MAKAQARPTDFTGVTIQRLQKEKEAELKAREGQISLIHQQEAEDSKRIVDLTGNPSAPVIVDDMEDEEFDDGLIDTVKVTVQPVVVEEEVDYTKGPPVKPAVVVAPVTVVAGPVNKKMRVNTDIEQMTFGYGKHYDFKVGVTYNIPIELYNWLEEQGYVRH